MPKFPLMAQMESLMARPKPRLAVGLGCVGCADRWEFCQLPDPGYTVRQTARQWASQAANQTANLASSPKEAVFRDSERSVDRLSALQEPVA